MSFTKRPLCSVAALLLLSGCWDHQLYDGKSNRFDTYYLGGGNSQFRPFRSARVDADASFELDLVAREGGAANVTLVAALAVAGEPEAVSGTLFWAGEPRRELARFTWDGEVSLVLDVPWRRLESGLAAGDELEAEFVDGNGATITLRFGEVELREAIAERTKDAR